VVYGTIVVIWGVLHDYSGVYNIVAKSTLILWRQVIDGSSGESHFYVRQSEHFITVWKSPFYKRVKTRQALQAIYNQVSLAILAIQKYSWNWEAQKNGLDEL
jgi:hypothetical protein